MNIKQIQKLEWLFRLSFALLLALSLAAPAVNPAQAAAPYYVRGAFNGWGTTDQMYDDGTHGDAVSGDLIYTADVTIATAGRYEWKVGDFNWSESYPSSNAWMVTTSDGQVVKFTFDTNTYSDGWYPTTKVVNAQDGVTNLTAVGDWQGWSNNNPATAMSDMGGGIYGLFTTIASAGTHYYKTVFTGTWDAIGPQGTSGGRSINTDNLGFTTTIDGQPVLFRVDMNIGRITVDVLPLINEIRIDETGTDVNEYLELVGTPNTSLDDLTYLVIGDGTGGSGVIEAVVNLNGQTIPSDGFFLAAKDADTMGQVTDFVTAAMNFENSDNVTHLLVYNFSGANAQDLDTNDDGTLDLTPWDQLIDLIALIKEDNPPSTTEYHYGPPTVGPDGIYVPGHAYICDVGWLIGPFDPTVGVDTPGYENYCPANLQITKTGPAYMMAGDTITYTISYTNIGVGEAEDVVITDTLPVSITYLSDTSGLTCNACIIGATGELTWTVDSLAVGIGGSFHLTGLITDTVVVGDILTNSVVITTTSEEEDLLDNEWEAATEISVPVLAIEKTVELVNDPALPGDVVTYVITVTNSGPVDAPGVHITDSLPGELIGTEIDDIVDIVAGGTYTIEFTATVDADTYSAVVTNTAHFEWEDQGNSAEVVFEVIDPPVLTIEKTVELVNDPALPGDVVTYVITVTNSGPADALGVHITDTLPADLIGSGVDLTVNVLGNDFYAHVFTATVHALAYGAVITNTAEFEWQDQGDSAEVVFEVIDPPVLAIEKTVALVNDPALPGDVVTYVITITNSGPADAIGVHITDTLPAELIGTGVDLTVTVPGNDFYEHVFTATVHALAYGAVVTNTAHFEWGEQSGSAEVVFDVVSAPDLVITKAVETAETPVRFGDVVTYTIAVSNNGAADALGVHIIDVLPEGLDGDDVHEIVDIATGDAYVLVFTATVGLDATPGEEIVNTATFEWGEVTGSAEATFMVIQRFYLPVIFKF
ncbi:MAG: DUF11 domain-containing protein [Anaerolineales bacterium]|nr:DUF11 domain-containing protein [Anaerolineales bacterium]